MSTNGEGAWRAFIDLLRLQVKSHVAAAVAPYDLTPPLAHALSVIPPDGITMRALADALTCDASNLTGIVDRLEKRKLLVRRVDPDDRRVKRVFLTAAGRRLQEKVDAVVRRPPPAIAALSANDQRVLREILERAVANAAAERLRSSA